MRFIDAITLKPDGYMEHLGKVHREWKDHFADSSTSCVIAEGVAVIARQLSTISPSSRLAARGRGVALRCLYYNKAKAKSQQKPPRAQL